MYTVYNSQDDTYIYCFYINPWFHLNTEQSAKKATPNSWTYHAPIISSTHSEGESGSRERKKEIKP